MPQNGENQEGGQALVTCRHCRHYYITWDRDFPHGCRVMGFKSRTVPAASVRQASGMGCQLFSRKGRREE